MSTTTAGALTIECAKPGCHWKGPPSEAADHDCPTPAVADPGNKITNNPPPEIAGAPAASVHENGFGDAPAGQHAGRGTGDSFLNPEQQAEAKANSTRFAQERADLEQRLTTAGVEYSKDLGLEDLRGLAALLVDEPTPGPGPDSQPEPALGDPAAGPPVTGDPPAYDSEPETVEQLGAWLAAHGKYDRNGAPDDERTLALDTRYGALVQAQHAAEAEPPPKPKRKPRAKKAGAEAPTPDPIEEEDSVRGSSSDELQLPESPSGATHRERTSEGITAGKLAETTLFDVGDYDDPSLALPGVDGRGIERIAVAFTGEVMLDRADPDHVALFKRLKLGQTVELWIEARGLGFAAKGATNKDGELDVVVAKRTLTVQHLRVMGPEDLKEAALEAASQARDAAENQDARDRKPEEA